MTARVAGPESLTVHVPLRIRKQGGRKQVLVPEGGQDGMHRPRVDHTMVKALARAFRWKRMLASGKFATIAELAQRERVAAPFLTRTMRLTQLAPDLVEAILDGRQPQDLTLEALRNPLPAAWSEQRRLLSASGNNHIFK